MTQAKPSRPKRQARKPKEPTTKPVETKEESNRYAPKMKVGKPTIGRSVVVETVGLGNLKVITQNGNTNV